MSWLDGFRHRIRTVLRPGRYAWELEQEMRLHRELDALHEGDPRGTRRRFGSPLYHREETRAQTWLRLVDVARQDLRAAWRGAVRSPAVAGLVIATLALGIGANAATFTILDLLYLKPPRGVAAPDSVRRYLIEHTNTPDGVPIAVESMTYPAYRVLADASGNPEGAALFATDWSPRLGRGFGGTGVRVVYASASYFPVVGVRVARGRFYTSHEDRMGRGEPVAVVAHAFWMSRLGGDPAVLGSRVNISGREHTVVGVLEPGFRGLDLQAADIWIPLASMPVPAWRGERWWEGESVSHLRMVERGGRPGREVEQRATARLRVHNREAGGRRPDTLTSVYTAPLVGPPGRQKPGRQHFIATRLAGVAAIVLVVAWANVINLLLARAAHRRAEIAVRLALGISRVRLVRTLLLEAGLLALAAAAAATLVGWAGGTALRALVLPEIAWVSSTLDGRIALFTLAAGLLSGLVAGILPALQASRPALTHALKSGAYDGGRHRSRVRTGLVALQAALSVTLLVGAALFVQSLRNVRALDLGFDAERLVFGRVEFAEGEEPPAPVVAAAAREIASRAAAWPGVEAVARAGMEPMRGFSMLPLFSDGYGPREISSSDDSAPFILSVSPGYFRAVGLRLLRGANLRGEDAEGSPAEVVVNEALARLIWQARDPVGRCLRIAKRDAPCHTVVGVVENSRWGYVIEPVPRPQAYVPLGNVPGGLAPGSVVIVRTAPRTARRVAADLRAALVQRFPAADVQTPRMIENLEPEYRPWRLGATLFTGLGLLALLVAVIGIYSTVSYGVSRRAHEFGVRAALGARLSDVMRLVVGEGLRTVALGVALGVAIALAAGRLIAAMLYGVSPGSPTVLIAVSGMLLAAGAGAAILPARRACRVDPVTALRAD